MQTILADAEAGVPDPSAADPPDTWSRTCKWKSAGTPGASVDLVIQGAKTQNGRLVLGVLAGGPGNGEKTPVPGLGEKATYWKNSGLNTLGLVTKEGDYTADVTAYFVEPPPTSDQLVPLVQKALDAL
ncbi:MAG: hypothetical protein U0263_25310 [Polyangiaceae bacterium]